LQIIFGSLNAEEAEAVHWKPTLIESKYKRLPTNNKLSKVVTCKPGLSGLTLA
jgi:hypothetical protein